MLEQFDGVILAVRDATVAAERFNAIFGGERDQTWTSKTLGAEVTGVRVGTDLIRLAQPSGPGPVAEHIEQWGEGLLAVVLATSDVDAIAQRLDARDVAYEAEDDALHLEFFGLRTEIAPVTNRDRVGCLSFLYEVTHLVDDWEAARDSYVDVFGLDLDRFSEIHSEHYGYDGTLTLLDPPTLLDRVEVVLPYGDGAMARFHRKRGQSGYMFYAESDSMGDIKRRLDSLGARYEARDTSDDPPGIFVHPSATHGVLIGLSKTDVAWTWSGRPELAPS